MGQSLRRRAVYIWQYIYCQKAINSFTWVTQTLEKSEDSGQPFLSVPRQYSGVRVWWIIHDNPSAVIIQHNNFHPLLTVCRSYSELHKPKWEILHRVCVIYTGSLFRLYLWDHLSHHRINTFTACHAAYHNRQLLHSGCRISFSVGLQIWCLLKWLSYSIYSSPVNV